MSYIQLKMFIMYFSVDQIYKEPEKDFFPGKKSAL